MILKLRNFPRRIYKLNSGFQIQTCLYILISFGVGIIPARLASLILIFKKKNKHLLLFSCRPACACVAGFLCFLNQTAAAISSHLFNPLMQLLMNTVYYLNQ